MATIKRRGNGWYVQIRRKGYPPQYGTFRTKTEGQAWAREQEAAIDRRDPPIDRKALKATTLGDLVRRYREDVTPLMRGAEAEAARLGKMIRAPICDLPLRPPSLPIGTRASLK